MEIPALQMALEGSALGKEGNKASTGQATAALRDLIFQPGGTQEKKRQKTAKWEERKKKQAERKAKALAGEEVVPTEPESSQKRYRCKAV